MLRGIQMLSLALVTIYAGCDGWGPTSVDSGTTETRDAAAGGAVKTSDIRADIDVTATGNGQIEVAASLRAGSAANTYLELVSGDKLFAISGSEKKEMTERRLLGAVWYSATFDVDAAGTEFVAAFERVNAVNAPNSHGTLPAAFSLSAPNTAAEFARTTDTIAITWDPSGSSDRMHVYANGTCIQAYDDDLDGDPGATAIPPNTFLEPADVEQRGKTCDVTIELRRTRPGSVDEAFAGGDFVARQVRSVKISSTP